MVEQARNAVGAAAAGGKDHGICVDWDLDILDVLGSPQGYIGVCFFGSCVLGLSKVDSQFFPCWSALFGRPCLIVLRSKTPKAVDLCLATT